MKLSLLSKEIDLRDQRIKILENDKSLQKDLMNTMKAEVLNESKKIATELQDELVYYKTKLDDAHRETMQVMQQCDDKMNYLEEKNALLKNALPDQLEIRNKLQNAMNEIENRSLERRDTKIKMAKKIQENPVKPKSAIHMYEKDSTAHVAFLIRSMESYYQDNLQKYNRIEIGYVPDTLFMGMHYADDPVDIYPLEFNLSIQLKKRFNNIMDLVSRTNIMEERTDLYRHLEKLIYTDFDTIKYDIYVRHMKNISKEKKIISKSDFKKNPYGYYHLPFSHELSKVETRNPSFVRRISSFRSKYDTNRHKINLVDDNVNINTAV
jgi:hypothetical protein